MTTRKRKPTTTMGPAALEVMRLRELYDFGAAPEREILLTNAAKTADLVDRLQTLVDQSESLRTMGSARNFVAIPELQELRQYRAQLVNRIKALALPDDDGGPVAGKPMSRSEVGRLGAKTRWGG